MIEGPQYLLAGLAAFAAGAVNALAGGGTLITFPTLVAMGMPPVAANVTNTVALCPGYLGGTLAQAGDLRDQRRRLFLLVPAGVLGGLAGAVLLLYTRERVFRELVPYLILLASGLLAVQDPVRSWVLGRARARGPLAGASTATGSAAPWSALAVAAAAIYGGYFGAGLSVIVLAVLGLVLDDTLTRLNALKQAIAFATNIAAAALFVFSGRVAWSVALVMAAGAILGGAAGGRLAGHVRPKTLRWTVVVLGVAIATAYLVR